MQLHMKNTAIIAKFKTILKNSRIPLIIILIVMSMMTVSCNYSSLALTGISAEDGSDNRTQAGSNDTPASTEPQNTETFYNYLTGLTTSEINSKRRPVSFCTENSSEHIPFGLKYADVLIEAPSAEDKTSMCVITTDYESAHRIGAISSMPSCLSDISSSLEAIKIYSGTTGYTLTEEKCALDALSCSSPVFFRDNTVNCADNLMADGSKIPETLAGLGYGDAMSDSYTLPYIIDDNSVYEKYNAAKYITIPYWNSLSVNFSYDSQTKKYIRMQNAKIYRDADNTELTYRTVLVLFCDTTTVSTHNGSSISLDMKNGGEGYAIFDGKAVQLNWKRDEVGHFILSDAFGAELKIPSGNIYIGLLQVSNKKDLVIGN